MIAVATSGRLPISPANLKIYVDTNCHWDGRAIAGAGSEFPATDSIDCLLIHTKAQSFNEVHLVRLSIGTDDHPQPRATLKSSFYRSVRINRMFRMLYSWWVRGAWTSGWMLAANEQHIMRDVWL